MANKSKKNVLDEVITNFKKEKVLKKKRTLVLSEDSYNVFERICLAQGKYPSEVVDDFIAVFVKRCK